MCIDVQGGDSPGIRTRNQRIKSQWDRLCYRYRHVQEARNNSYLHYCEVHRVLPDILTRILTSAVSTPIKSRRLRRSRDVQILGIIAYIGVSLRRNRDYRDFGIFLITARKNSVRKWDYPDYASGIPGLTIHRSGSHLWHTLSTSTRAISAMVDTARIDDNIDGVGEESSTNRPEDSAHSARSAERVRHIPKGEALRCSTSLGQSHTASPAFLSVRPLMFQTTASPPSLVQQRAFCVARKEGHCQSVG